MIPIAKPIIGEEEIQAAKEVLQSGMLAEGKVSREFEKQFAHYVGAKHATVTTNGTTALSTAMEAMEIQPGDEVITTSFTFIASANTIAMVGAVPVFVDIRPDTYNMDPNLIEKAISDKTRAIMPVHIFGNPCEMGPIMEIAEKHDLLVIEDACQAHGAIVDGKMVGSIGHVATFSFYATKNLMTGEGGMITTDDQEIHERCLMIKNHGRGPEGGYTHYRIGYNYRMLDIVAALGIVQMERMPGVVKRRRENAKVYDEFFQNIEQATPQVVLSGMDSGYHVYAPRIRSETIVRDELVQSLRREGVGSRPVYAIPCHKQEAYKNISKWRWAKHVDYPDYSSLSLPNSEEIGDKHFEIPVHPGVGEEEMKHVLDVLGRSLS